MKKPVILGLIALFVIAALIYFYPYDFSGTSATTAQTKPAPVATAKPEKKKPAPPARTSKELQIAALEQAVKEAKNLAEEALGDGNGDWRKAEAHTKDAEMYEKKIQHLQKQRKR